MVDQNNQLLFVQFLHPGSEHTPDRNNQNHISWNQNAHKRKFIKNPGIYLKNNGKITSDLVFWGEWEPQSDVIQKLKLDKKGEPQYLYQPYFSLPQHNQFLQNTDPFVFGDNFYYVCCQQVTKRGFTQLRFLESGSVILFGSCLNNKFVLDTVFVIDRYYEIESLMQIYQYVSDTYVDVTLRHILSCMPPSPSKCNTNQNFRLYVGATFDNPINEMFSFFSCLPYSDQINKGFSRPIIEIPNVISDLKNQGYKLTRNRNLQQLWQQTKNQVEQVGLEIGIHSKLPPKKKFS
jgi:hypothetical protein